MPTIPPHPLSKPHLDQLAGLNDPNDVASAEEIGRRVQELWNQWQVYYFSGNPFTSPGEADPKTFEHLEVLWAKSVPTTPGVRPILHTILTDRRDENPRRIPGGLAKVVGKWTWSTFVRAHPQMPVAGNPANLKDSAVRQAERVCDRAADQYAWLLRSAHAQELAMKGISHIEVVSGPRPVPTGAWHLNQIIVSATITFRIRHNAP